MSLSKREVILLILLGIVAILVLGINFLVLPMTDEVKTAQELAQQKDDELLVVQTDIQTAGRMQELLQSEYAKAAELAQPYNGSMNQEEIDLWLNGLLANNNLQVQNMDISNMAISTASFEKAALNDVESIPIQDAADIVNGNPAPTASPEPTQEEMNEGSKVNAAAQAANEALEASGDTQTDLAGSLYQINAVVNVVGTLDGVIGFANSLYESGRALRVTSLSTQESVETGLCSAVIAVEFYGIPAVQDVALAGTGE